jgi:hypothetical protein
VPLTPNLGTEASLSRPSLGTEVSLGTAPSMRLAPSLGAAQSLGPGTSIWAELGRPHPLARLPARPRGLRLDPGAIEH